MKLHHMFKQLFCKHIWEYLSETWYNITFKCSKCGKKKTYWN